MLLDCRATRRTDYAKRRAAGWRKPVAALTRSPLSADMAACGKWSAIPAPWIKPAWRVVLWPGPEQQHRVANLAEPNGKPVLNILKSLKRDVRSTKGPPVSKEGCVATGPIEASVGPAVDERCAHRVDRNSRYEAGKEEPAGTNADG